MVEAVERRVLLSQTWFVSPSGSNSNPGTLNAPLQTIQAAANLAHPGDTVMIEAGTYHETVTPPRSGTADAPITFEAYNNEQVIISGADPISGWNQYSGSLYDAAMSWDQGDGNNQVFVDGQMINEARFPNTSLDVSHPTTAVVSAVSNTSTDIGWLYPELVTIDDPSLTAPAGTWDGATIHIGSGEGWVVQTGTVLSSAVGSLTVSLEHLTWFERPRAGNTYYLTGSFNALDAAGEWYRDPTTGLLYVWTPTGDSPTAHDIEVKHRLYAFELGGRSYINVAGISLFAATIDSNSSSSSLTLSSLSAQYVSQSTVDPFPWDSNSTDQGFGIQLNGSNDILQNSTIAFSSGDGVYVSGSNDTVQNCTIDDVDYAGGDGAGITVVGSDQQILGNTIYNAARSGIVITSATASIVDHNIVHDVGLQTTDLGGIYAFNSNGQGTQITFNTIYNATVGGYGAGGVFLDNGCSNYFVHDNTIYNVDHGLKLNPPGTNNAIFNNSVTGGSNELVPQPGDSSGSGNGVTDLGNLGGFTTEADAINNVGQIVGISATGTGNDAFVQTAGTMSSLGTLGGDYSAATAINSAGVIVGTAYSGTGFRQAFIDSSGTMTGLGILPGTIASEAFGVNAARLAVGISYDNAGEDHAFSWLNGTMTAIPTLGGTISAAFGVNDSGWIVGASTIAGNLITHAFLDRNGTLTDLGTLGGSTSYALAVGNQGEIVGESRISGDGALHAFSDVNGTMTDLGTLPGLPDSVATGVNDHGDIVGYAYSLATFTQHAFIYHDGVMTDLNMAVPNNGWTFTFATGINDSGQIVGSGSDPSGYSRAFEVTLPQNTGTAGPTALITAPDITAPGGSTQTITVTYSDAAADIVLSSIGTANLSISNPEGAALTITGIEADASSNAPMIEARYIVAVPGGQWTAADNGTYTVSLVPGQVTDTAANAATGVPITFNVAIPSTSPLTETVIGRLPTSAVAGQRVGPVTQVVTITNGGTTTVAGKVTINLQLSTDSSGNGGGESVAIVTRKINLPPGRHIAVPVSFHLIPAGLSGNLFVLAEVEDPNGGVSVAASAGTISTQAPFVDLLGAFVGKLLPVRNGHASSITLAVTEAGNVPVAGLLGIDLFLSSSGVLDSNSIDLGMVARRITVQPGRRALVSILRTIPKGLSGDYTIIATLSDPGNAFNEPTLSASPIFGPTLSIL
jgi:probable HAF family extracellular repeat protein